MKFVKLAKQLEMLRCRGWLFLAFLTGFPLCPGDLESLGLLLPYVLVDQRDHLGFFLGEGDFILFFVLLVTVVKHEVAAQVEMAVDDVLGGDVGVAQEIVEDQVHIGPAHAGLAVEVEPCVFWEGLDESDEIVDAARVGEAVVKHCQTKIAQPAFGAGFSLCLRGVDVKPGGVRDPAAADSAQFDVSA